MQNGVAAEKEPMAEKVVEGIAGYVIGKPNHMSELKVEGEKNIGAGVFYANVLVLAKAKTIAVIHAW